MFSWFKKKTLPKHLSLLCALPYNRDSFEACLNNRESDFGRSLRALYNSEQTDELWRKFQSQSEYLNRLMDEIEKLGGTVVRSFSLGDLDLLRTSDIAIILAHHSNCSDELEIGGHLVRTKVFVDAIPADCTMCLDITSCYSAYLLPWIKSKNPKSRILGIDIPTPLDLRLNVLESIVKHLVANPKDDYLTVFKNAWSNRDLDSYKQSDGTAMLGSKLTSSVYAPKEACRGESFIVSAFLYKGEHEDEVEIRAKSIDEAAEKRNSLCLRCKLKKDDLVEFQYKVIGAKTDTIMIDEEVKSLFWQNEIESVEFIVTIGDDYKGQSLISKLRLFVNKELQGDMAFKISIHDTPILGSTPCASMEFVPFDKIAEMHSHKQGMLKQLSKKMDELKSTLPKDVLDNSVEYQMCKRFEELLTSTQRSHSAKPKIVFISSTADMYEYRKIMRDAVESCEMYPDMYENWGQGNDYPRDMCCKHVMDSDIFVCILGARYGYVEPIWNKSMTEIEYRTAVCAGIPTLLYIVDGYTDALEQLSEEADKQLAERQRELIKEVSSNRLVYIFKSILDLQIASNKHLLTLKFQ